MSRIKTPSFVHAVFHYYPFSPSGTALFAALMYVLGKSYAQKNSYGLFLSFAGVFVLFLLILFGRIQARKFAAASPAWDSNEALYAGREGTCQVLSVPQVKCFIFFRMHFRVTGKLKTDSASYLPFYAESGFSGGGSLRLPFTLPVSGLARVRGVCLIRDIFGLTRSRFGEPMHRELPVQPRLLTEQARIDLDTMGGFDSKNRRKNSDEEKYYMREYIPGDRIRDINWKASTRVNKFITRISPVTQEKTKVLYIDIRTYKEPGPASLDGTLHLDYLKSRLITFLWNVKRDHDDYSFILRTGRDEYKVDTIKDIVKLAAVVSTLWYHTDRNLFPDLPASSRLFIFTTAFDTGLSRAITYYAGYTLTIMTTASKPKNSWERENVTETALIPKAGLYLPKAWMLRREIPAQSGTGGISPGNADVKVLSCSLFPQGPKLKTGTEAKPAASVPGPSGGLSH